MERWVKYKDNFINIGQCRSLRIQKAKFSKNDMQGVAYYGDEAEPTKEKPWMVIADHQTIEVFEKKPQAVEFCQKILEGKYNV